MSDPVPIVVAVGAVLAGLGGLMAGVYYAVRLAEWLRERMTRVSVEIVSYSIDTALHPDRHMLVVELRLYNPKARPYVIAEARLTHKHGAFLLRPVQESRYGESVFTKQTPIELPPKRHSQLTLGYSMKEAAKYEASVWQQNSVVIDLDEGSRVVSKPFDWGSDVVELVLGAKPPRSD